jgi:hypothetical protein
MNPISIICHTQSECCSIKKIIREFPPDTKIDVSFLSKASECSENIDELLTSKALKLVCSRHKTALVLGVNRERVFEKNLACIKSYGKIIFIDYPVGLHDLYQLIEQQREKLRKPFEVKCSACRLFNGRNTFFYSEFVLRKSCHDIKNIFTWNIKKKNMVDFVRIGESLDQLKHLFIPPCDEGLIDEFLSDFHKVRETAKNKDIKTFTPYYMEFRKESRIKYKQFPFIGKRSPK